MADVSFFSPYAVGGATRPDSFTNLNPLMRSRLMEMLMAAKEELGPDALRITSAYRSPELQGQLYQEALKKYGTPEETRRWVAPAGRSQHNFGTAVDFANLQGQLLRDPNSPEAKWLKANAARFGLAVPLPNEPWQVELEGARSGNISQGQQMRLSTKDAPMEPNKPKTLWGRLTSTGERSGLNPLEAFAAALDPLIMPEMRVGGAIREAGAQRAAFAKEDKAKNATLNELRKRAASGDKIAQRYYEAISTGALDTKTGFSGYLNEVGQMAQLDKRLAAEAKRIGVSSGDVHAQTALPLNRGFQFIDKKGNVTVVDSENNVLKGKEATDYIAQANADKQIYDANTAAGKVVAKSGAEAYMNLPSVENTVQNTMEAISIVKNSQNLANVLGRVDGLVDPESAIGIAKYSQADVDLMNEIDYLQSTVFMQAFESLKGAGPITEKEAEAGMKAVANLKRTSSPETFLRQISIIENKLKQVMETARWEAGQYSGAPKAEAPNATKQTQTQSPASTEPQGKTFKWVDIGNGVMKKVYD